jgi:hypothetical protein
MSKLNRCPSCSHELNYLSIETFKNTHICTNCGTVFKNKTIVNVISFGVGILLLFIVDSPFRTLIAYLTTIALRTLLTYLLGYRLTKEVVNIETVNEERENECVIAEIPNYDAKRLIYLLVALVVSLVLFIMGVVLGTSISNDQHVIGKVIGIFNLVGFLYFQWMLLYAVRGRLYIKIKNNLNNYLGYIVAWCSISFLFLYVFNGFNQNGYEDIIMTLLQVLVVVSVISVIIQYSLNHRKEQN